MAKKTKISRKPKPSRKADFDDEKAVLREFCEAENCEPSHCSIEEDRRLRGFGVGTYYQIACGRNEYQIAKDHDSMRDLAIEIVKQDLESEPELFNKDFIENNIDTDKLRDALRSDVEDGNRDYAKDIGAERFWKEADGRGIDIPDDVQEARDAGDDPRKPSDAEIDAFAEDMTTDQLQDPMGYLDDIYGREEAVAQAIKIAGIDVDRAAEEAVDADGPEHFVAHYDGKSHETKSGFVYWRTN